MLGLAVLALGACGSSSPSVAQGDGGGGGGGGAADGGSGAGNGDASNVPSGPPGNIAVWTTGLGRKVQPTSAPSSGTSISVASCRAAWASAQLVVRGQNGNLQQVTVAVDDLTDGAGHTLARSNVTFFREYFIDYAGAKAEAGNLPVPTNSPTSDSKLPDPLIPLVDPYTGANAGQPFNVEPSTNQPVFVDVHVPSGTPAGTYTGKIHVVASAGRASDVPLSVTVWAVDLPDMRTVTAHFGMNINPLFQYHAGLSDCTRGPCYLVDNPATQKIVKRYEELAHDHRIDPGQSFTYEPVSGCTVPTDWSQYDAAMGPYMDGSYFSDGVPSTRMEVPFSPGQAYGLDAQCNQTEYVALAAAWAAHLKAKGWFDRAVAYCADEPQASVYPQIATNSSWLQQADPGWRARVVATTAPSASNEATLNPALGTYIVNLKAYDTWNQPGTGFAGRAEWPGLIAQGIHLWLYESDSSVPPYPTFSSDTIDGLEPAMALWGAWYEKASGFLYWDVTAWEDKNPWGTNIGYGQLGDGVLLYPGHHAGTLAPAGSPPDVAIDGPVPSYRLKVIRNGLQDWALFALADQKGLTSMVQQQLATVYSQLGGCGDPNCQKPANGFFWKTDEKAMDGIRQTVAQAVAAAH